jgi:hypothetical protein
MEDFFPLAQNVFAVLLGVTEVKLLAPSTNTAGNVNCHSLGSSDLDGLFESDLSNFLSEG